MTGGSLLIRGHVDQLQAGWSVIVPVPVVGRVPVPVVHVVGVPIMRHGDVAAVRTVLVSVPLVSLVGSRFALVGVVAVDAVDVTVVRVIGVTIVRECDVTAAIAMGVLVPGVGGVLGDVWHGDRSSCLAGALSASSYVHINI